MKNETRNILRLSENPVFLRWVKSLKGRGLLTALVPTFWGLAFLAVQLTLPGLYVLKALVEVLALPVALWLVSRGVSLALIVKTPERSEELDSTPLTPLDFFHGAAVPLLIESLPFYLCHLWISLNIILAMPLLLPIQLPTIVANISSSIGMLILPIALFQFAPLRRFHYWLALPVYLIGTWLLHLGWTALHSALGLSVVLDLQEGVNAPLNTVLLALSLTPLFLLPGPAVALFAARSSLGSAWSSTLRKSLVGFCCLVLLLVGIGQGTAAMLRVVLTPLLELDPVTAIQARHFEIPDAGRFLSPTSHGFLTMKEGSLTEYDSDFNELRTLAFDPKLVQYPRAAWASPEGTIRLFHQGGMLDLLPDGGTEAHPWPASLPGKQGDYMPEPFMGTCVSASGRLARYIPSDAALPRARMERREMLTGELIDSRPLPVGGILFFFQLTMSQAFNTNELLTEDTLSGRLQFFGLDEPTVRQTQLWPLQQYFRRTDLGKAELPDIYFMGSVAADRTGNLFYLESGKRGVMGNTGAGSHNADGETWIYVVREGRGNPRIFRIDTPGLLLQRYSFILDGRLFIGGSMMKDQSSTVLKHRGGLWSVELSDLGVSPEASAE